MVDILKMAAVKGGQLQFTILNFTELTDLYVFVSNSMLMNSRNLNLHIFCMKIQNGGQLVVMYKMAAVKNCQYYRLLP